MKHTFDQNSRFGECRWCGEDREKMVSWIGHRKKNERLKGECQWETLCYDCAKQRIEWDANDGWEDIYFSPSGHPVNITKYKTIKE